MPESDLHHPRKIVKKIEEQFQEAPLPESAMLPHEKRAQAMQTAMKERLQRDFPKDPEFGFLPYQWAVRTSMDELRNTTALDDALQELGDELREKLAFDLGATEDQVEQHFR